jgi:hypothetical protein
LHRGFAIESGVVGEHAPKHRYVDRCIGGA